MGWKGQKNGRSGIGLIGSDWKKKTDSVDLSYNFNDLQSALELT